MAIISRGLDAIARLCVLVSCTIVLGAAVAQIVGGLERMTFGFGFTLFSDLPHLLIPWAVMPLLGVLLRNGRHITVDILPTTLSPRGARALSVLVFIVCILAGLMFTIAGVEAVQAHRRMGMETETEIAFPVWWIYLAFPVGFGLFTLFAMEGAVKALIGGSSR